MHIYQSIVGKFKYKTKFCYWQSSDTNNLGAVSVTPHRNISNNPQTNLESMKYINRAKGKYKLQDIEFVGFLS